MSYSSFERDDLMVSYVDERVAVDGLARLDPEEASQAGEFAMFPLEADWRVGNSPVVGYSIPPAEAG
jgi:hypothetical protein